MFIMLKHLRIIRNVPFHFKSEVLGVLSRNIIQASNDKSTKAQNEPQLFTHRSEYRHFRKYQGLVKAVIFDWAGTIVDCGVYSPALAFIDLFKNEGIAITDDEARGPMGIHKRIHIMKILELDSVRQRWLEKHGKPPTVEDIDRMYNSFVPTVLASINKYSNVIKGVTDSVQELRQEYNLKIGTTTGFPTQILNVLKQSSTQQGFTAEANVAADEVPDARPCPYMVWTCAMRLGVHQIESIIKVDDTVDGIREGLAARCWTVGVAKTVIYGDTGLLATFIDIVQPIKLMFDNISALGQTVNKIFTQHFQDAFVIRTKSSYMGMTEKQLEEAPKDELEFKLNRSYSVLSEAGAHYVVDSVIDLPAVVRDINQRLAYGDQP